MTTTTPHISREGAPAPRPAHDRPRAERRDPTAPTHGARFALRDDRSHTPPHGDAILAPSIDTSDA